MYRVGRVLTISMALFVLSCSAPITTYFDPIDHTNSARVGPPSLEGYYSLPRTILVVEVKTASQSAPKASGPATTGEGGSAGGTGGAPPAAKAADEVAATVENITLTRKTEADPHARLLYRFEPSAFSDDIVLVETDEGGLLTNVSADTTDRSGNIAIAVADLVFAIQTRGAINPFTKSIFAEPLTPLKASFDPTDPNESRLAGAALLQRGYCLLIGPQIGAVQSDLRRADNAVAAAQQAMAARGKDVDSKTNAAIQEMQKAYPRLLAACQSTASNPSFADDTIEYANRNGGIYYRRPIQTPVAIYKLQDKNNSFSNVMQPSLLWTGNVPVFNKQELYRIDIDRSAFVRRQTNIKFANGTLNSIKLDKPSEVLAGIGIPVTVLRIAFAIPLAGLNQNTTLNNARVANTVSETNVEQAQINANTAALNAQTAAITARVNNLNAQAQLLKLQTATGDTGVLVPQ